MLPRAARLLHRRDFRAAYSRSRSFATARLILYAHQRKRGADESRLRVGFSISRKNCRKAHDRNLLKRRLREIVRLDILPDLADRRPADVIVAAKATAADADFETIRADVAQLFRDAGIIAKGARRQ